MKIGATGELLSDEGLNLAHSLHVVRTGLSDNS
jgi:hypothetical protein